MSIALLKHKKGRQRGSSVIVVLVLSMTGWFFTPTKAEEDCAMDFFTHKTCRSFDTPDRVTEQNSNPQESSVGANLWKGYSRLPGSQIWHRNPFDGNWMSITARGQEALGNRAIHGIRCLTDLFGNVACNRDELTPEIPLDKKLPDQR
jgi:hypothetical protein